MVSLLGNSEGGTEPILQTFNLTKYFGSVTALDNVNIAVYPGVTGLLGPNGAGKSTLIKILLGLIRPTSGTARVLNLDCQRKPKLLHHKLGVLHEKPVFPKTFTAYRFLQLVCRFHDLTDEEEQVRSILEAVELWDDRNRRIGNFSAGMVQRLGLAQALIGKPDFVFLDEPTANLDPLGRLQILRRIRQIHEESGTSFLVSSHILHDLERICDAIILINNGKIILQGSLKELLENAAFQTVTVRFRNRMDISQLPSSLSWIQVEQIDPFTFCFQVEDTLAFQIAFFRWAIRTKNLIQNLSIDSNLEQLYSRIFTSGEGKDIDQKNNYAFKMGV